MAHRSLKKAMAEFRTTVKSCLKRKGVDGSFKVNGRYTEKERNFLNQTLLKNKAEYEKLIQDRIDGKVSDYQFSFSERFCEHKGSFIRELLGISAKAVGGAYCEECHHFFETDNLNRDGFMNCRQHRNKREFFMPKSEVEEIC